jgi:Helix-turn-helix domain
VQGLRREELAGLAGLSTAYYARLEQGRHSHPSPTDFDAMPAGQRNGVRWMLSSPHAQALHGDEWAATGEDNRDVRP